MLASSVLISNSRIAEGLLEQWACLNTSTAFSSKQARRSVVSYAADMHVHQQSLRYLLELLQSTQRMVSLHSKLDRKY